ncbi:MAG: YigZ family protein [Cytophagales bacterium]
MTEIHNYKTISKPSEGIYKEKGSKFLSFLHQINTEEEAKEILKKYKKDYFDARHHCYALILNNDSSLQKYSDDGEPAHTAGTPILNKLKSYELTNVICVVVRFFGGTKLGVPGLIEAYKESTEDAIKNTEIITKEITCKISISTDYESINDLMRLCKLYEIEIENQKYENDKIITELNYTLKNKNSILNSIEKNYKFEVIS